MSANCLCLQDGIRQLERCEMFPACPCGGPDLQDAVTLARDADEALENEISAACARLSMATTNDCASMIFEQLRILIAQRSPNQIARMERQRGLRK